MNSTRLSRLYQSKKAALHYVKYSPSYPQLIADRIIKCMKKDESSIFSQERFSRMLDVGCDGGQMTQLFSSHFTSILGIDISEGMIEVAREKNCHDNVTFQLVHDNIFPVEDNSIDLVNCATAIHFMNLSIFESECERVLKPNGCVAAYSYFPESLSENFTHTESKKNLEHTAEFLRDCNGSPNSMSAISYKHIYDKIKTKRKLWIDGIHFKQTHNLHELKELISTLADYRRYIEKGNVNPDPLDIYIDRLKKLLKGEGMKKEEIQLGITWKVPMFVFYKQQS